ncbi:MAG TPA: hypothetical protein PLI51_09935 [bacterium]|nr:hypothetical protein [bacterium]HPQ67032.1 hypothetical protein [bacterium]
MSAVDPLRLLAGLRRRQLRNLLRDFSGKNTFRWAASAVAVVLAWAGLFRGGLALLHFIYDIPGLGPLLGRRLGYMAAMAFFLLLVFSNAVVSFQLQYRSRETGFFLSAPLPSETLVAFIGAETFFLSTWASLFLALPLAAAWAVVARLEWFGPLAFPLFGLPLALLATALGMILSALVPGLTRTRVMLIAAGLVAWSALRRWGPLPAGGIEPEIPGMAAGVVNDLLAHTRLSLHPLMPSSWAAAGFFAFSSGTFSQAASAFTVLAVNTLFALALAFHLNCSWLRRHYSRSLSAGGKTTRLRRSGRLFDGLLRFLPRTFRAMATKDILLFVREPLQWGQGLILFGLLGIYIFSIRGMPGDIRQPFWQTLVTVFNLGASTLILSTMTTRFVFPQISLEGRAFWILGLSPIPRSRVLWIKLGVNLAWALPVVVGLLALSCRYLDISGKAYLLVLLSGAAMTLTLALCAVGMGAIFPEFGQENPARIAAGFGGTINLVVSLAYVAGTVALVGSVYYLHLIRRGSPLLFAEGAAVFLLLSAGTGPLVFVLGLRRFRRLEP